MDNKASSDDDEMVSENEDMKVAAVPRKEYLERKTKYASSQMSSMDTNEINIEDEDMKVAPVSQETCKCRKNAPIDSDSSSSMDIDIKCTENVNKKANWIVESQRRRKECCDKAWGLNIDVNNADKLINDEKLKKRKKLLESVEEKLKPTKKTKINDLNETKK